MRRNEPTPEEREIEEMKQAARVIKEICDRRTADDACSFCRSTICAARNLTHGRYDNDGAGTPVREDTQGSSPRKPRRRRRKAVSRPPLLDRLMTQYGIDEAEIAEERLEKCFFRYQDPV